jgi:hypothetical protein
VVLNTVVQPAPHRRELQERRAPAEQRARYWFDLQFGVVRLMNIPTLPNTEDTDNWIRFLLRTLLDHVKVLLVVHKTQGNILKLVFPFRQKEINIYCLCFKSNLTTLF